MSEDQIKAQFCGNLTTDKPSGFTKEDCAGFMINYCRPNYANQSCINHYKENKSYLNTSELENFCRLNANVNTELVKQACACHYPSSVYTNYLLKQVEGVTDKAALTSLKMAAGFGPTCSYPDCQAKRGIPRRDPPTCPPINIQNCINAFNTTVGGSFQGRVDSRQYNQCVQQLGSGNVNIDNRGVSDKEEQKEAANLNLLLNKSFILLVISIFALLITIILGIAFQNMIIIVISSIVTLSLLLASFLTRQKVDVSQTQTKGKTTIQKAKSSGPPIITLLRNEKSRLCLDITDVNAFDKIIDTPCDNLPTQKFILESSNERINVNSSPNLTFDDIYTSVPYQQKLQIFDSIPNNPNQSFVYNKNTKQIENTSKNMCVSRGDDGFYYMDLCKDIVNQKFDMI